MVVIVYTKERCLQCRYVLTFLRRNNIRYEEREIFGNTTYMQELVEKSGQKKTPTIDLNGKILADADRKSVERFLILEDVLK